MHVFSVNGMVRASMGGRHAFVFYFDVDNTMVKLQQWECCTVLGAPSVESFNTKQATPHPPYPRQVTTSAWRLGGGRIQGVQQRGSREGFREDSRRSDPEKRM